MAGCTPRHLKRCPSQFRAVSVRDVHRLVAGVLQPGLKKGADGRNPGNLDAPRGGIWLKRRLRYCRIDIRVHWLGIFRHGPHDLGERSELLGRATRKHEQPQKRKAAPAAPCMRECLAVFLRGVSYCHGSR